MSNFTSGGRFPNVSQTTSQNANLHPAAAANYSNNAQQLSPLSSGAKMRNMNGMIANDTDGKREMESLRHSWVPSKRNPTNNQKQEKYPSLMPSHRRKTRVSASRSGLSKSMEISLERAPTTRGTRKKSPHHSPEATAHFSPKSNNSSTSPTASKKRKSPYLHTPKLLKDIRKQQKKRHHSNSLGKNHHSPVSPLHTKSLPSLSPAAQSPQHSTSSPKHPLTVSKSGSHISTVIESSDASDDSDGDELAPDFNAAYDFLAQHQKLQDQNADLSDRIHSLERALSKIQHENHSLKQSLRDKDKYIDSLHVDKQNLEQHAGAQVKKLEQQNLKSRIITNYWQKDKAQLNSKMETLTENLDSLETKYRREKLFHQEELDRIKTEYSIGTWEHKNQHRFDQEVALYKALADDYQSKWQGQQDRIDALEKKLSVRDSTVESLEKDCSSLKRDKRNLKHKLRNWRREKKEYLDLIQELQVKASFLDADSGIKLDASKLQSIQTADDGTQYRVEQDGSIVPIIREDGNSKRKQRCVGVNGEFDEQGNWRWYSDLEHYDPKLVGKKKEQVTGETADQGEWQWYLGFDPTKKIGKKIPGVTGFYSEGGVWVWYDMFSPLKHLSSSGDRVPKPKNEPLKLNAQSKIKSIVWNKNYKPRKWKKASPARDAKSIARAFV